MKNEKCLKRPRDFINISISLRVHCCSVTLHKQWIRSFVIPSVITSPCLAVFHLEIRLSVWIRNKTCKCWAKVQITYTDGCSLIPFNIVLLFDERSSMSRVKFPSTLSQDHNAHKWLIDDKCLGKKIDKSNST